MLTDGVLYHLQEVVMRVVVLQAPYPTEQSKEAALGCMDWMLARVRSLAPGDQDLVVLPECANVPGIETPVLLRTIAEHEGGLLCALLPARRSALGVS